MALTSIVLRAQRAAKLASTTVLLLACSTQYADPIRRDTTQTSDPCTAWLTEAECQRDTAHGCSFQPNDPGCRPQDLSCAPGACRGGDPFVRRSGETLWLGGDPYRFTGAVSWGLAWAEEGCKTNSQPDFETNLTRTFQDLVPMRASVLKLWAFQTFAGATGTDYSAFQRIVEAARRAGVRLIFVLETHWGECSRGGERDDAWYATGHAAPYGGYVLSLPDYTRRLVTHFRDEPTILAWEIMHEARGQDFEALDGFTRSMASLIRENDSNHLIAPGLDNGDSPATTRSGTISNYRRLHEHPAIDLVDLHDFGDESTPLSPALSEGLNTAVSLQKAAFAGATAVRLQDTSTQGFQDRANFAERKLRGALDAGFVGLLLYDYYPDWDSLNWSFDGRSVDPLAGPDGVMARNAPSTE